MLAVALTFFLDNRIASRQEAAEDRRFQQQEVLENLRFVRDRSADPEAFKPFRGLELPGVDLSGLTLGCEEDEAPTCADLQRANLREAQMVETDLSFASLVQADLGSASLIDSRLRGADLDAVQAPDALFAGSDLQGVSFRDASMPGADFVFVDLTGADLTEANLAGADLLHANLEGADLTGAVLIDADLGEAKLGAGASRAQLKDVCYSEGTIWPEGFTPTPRSHGLRWSFEGRICVMGDPQPPPAEK